MHTERLKNLEKLPQVAGKIVDIATDTIDRIRNSRQSLSHPANDRFFSTHFLAGVITPLGSVICATILPSALRENALYKFREATKTLKEIGLRFGLARQLLLRSQSTIDAVSRVPPISNASLNPLGKLLDHHNMETGDFLGNSSNVSDEVGNEENSNEDIQPSNNAGVLRSSVLVSYFPSPAPGFESLGYSDEFNFDADWLIP